MYMMNQLEKVQVHRKIKELSLHCFMKPCSHTKTLLLMKYPGKKPINDYSHFLAYTCSRAQTHVTAHTSDTAYYIAHTSFCTCT